MPDGQIFRGTADDVGLACLTLVARYFQLPLDAAQICPDYDKTDGVFARGDVIRCAKRAGLLARLPDKAARTVLCGGRAVMRVPTESVFVVNNFK